MFCLESGGAPDEVVLEFVGDLESGEQPQLESQLEAALSQRPSVITLRLNRVTSFDPDLVDILVDFSVKLKSGGFAAMRIKRPLSDSVAAALELKPHLVGMLRIVN